MMKRILSLFLILALLCGGAMAEVATDAEKTEVQEVTEEGMSPIDGAKIRDGVYDVTVNSSSSMFKIVACQLTVQDGTMTAEMTMSSTGYLKLFMGTGEEAVAASEDAYIPFQEDAEGVHRFTVPVAALDQALDCAAFSKRKEKWYDRKLLFRADSLLLEAFQDGTLATAATLNLADGEYQVDVKLVGDVGKASVESPATLRVENGVAWATIVWGSSKYDYVRVNGEKYLPLDREGNAAFEIPVNAFDWNLAIVADSTALGIPVEMNYSIRFDAQSIR